MKTDEVVIRVGGAAGDGVQSAGLIIAKAFSRSGLHANTYNYYQSIIRGGQSWYQIRASDRKVRSQGDNVNVMIALNKDSLERHTSPTINEGGASPIGKDGLVIYDQSISDFRKGDCQYCALPLSEIAARHGKNALMKNTVAIGAAMASIGINFEVLASVIRDQFGNKGTAAEENVKAAKEGYDHYLQNFKKLNVTLKTSSKKFYLISGGESLALGAVNAGMKMYVAYPMTPASSALHYLAEHEKDFKIFVKIPEDEISAVNMAIGANYAGVRAMTGSSGGGFSLMVEALGMSGMMEVPLVIYESQRAGPSTGLPTKTEQGDLNLVIGASQGDFPRIVLAPRNVEDAFYCTREAFNLAEKYQVPVIVMSDLYVAEHYETVEKFDLNFKIERGKIASPGSENYRRYEYTSDGISFRALPGTAELMHNEDSDEHNEYGDVVSDAVTDPTLRVESMKKRMRKLDGYIREMPPTPTYRYDDAEIAIIQWGGTQGVVEEAVDALREKGIRVGLIEINRVYPLNPDIGKLLHGKKQIIVVENNYSGQMNRLLRSEFLVKTDLVTKFDGESFYPRALTEEIETIIKR
ncbi:MAG: 2-oxoacid:acceptor oxidoreductase subunit alpha [Candidatus Thermoplasmatota archaeon]|nr:2-oxoacid:acceptor oxidoreductase subunit alpha [Candidatus Thermoplasmatota archaeon]MDA8143015.1 2-oxoacid:acceptor oxidoreductase subunit alpha [Thermoplasmatales archaeon]